MVFDENRTGEFLPLIWADSAEVVNEVEGFGIPTYVGDSRQNSKTNIHEAITGIASVLNGTLLGMDKSRYVPMLSSHFHQKNGIGLYLNQVGTRGDSFWYDLLPSLLFTHGDLDCNIGNRDVLQSCYLVQSCDVLGRTKAA